MALRVYLIIVSLQNNDVFSAKSILGILVYICLIKISEKAMCFNISVVLFP